MPVPRFSACGLRRQLARRLRRPRLSCRWTGILAPGLSKQNILDSLMKRRCYSTLDRNCVLLFRVNGAEMGTVIEEPVKQVEIEVIVDEADNGDLTAKIELFEDGVVVQTDEPNAENRRWETTVTPKPGQHYYFAKVTQKDGNLVWSAPVWVTVEMEKAESDGAK
jgi:hypothetical protein